MVRNITDMNKILDYVLNDTDESECSGPDLEKEICKGDSDIDWQSDNDENLVQLAYSREENTA